MKLIHLSDLHLGKRVNEYSMLEDQEYILLKILNIIDDEQPDGVMIAGDVYDKSVPSAEAVSLFDDFLVRLAERKIPVFVISGNHDSPERIAFGSRIMNAGGIYMSPVYHGKIEPVRLYDAYGEVNIYMLPFIKPAHVRRFHEEDEIQSYTDALRTAVSVLFILNTILMAFFAMSFSYLERNRFYTSNGKRLRDEVTAKLMDNSRRDALEYYNSVLADKMDEESNGETDPIHEKLLND